MGRDHRKSPRLESLEGRRLLSAAHFDHIVNPGGRMVPSAATIMNGTLKGNVNSFQDLAGPPETMTEVFTGRVRSMGAVKAVVADQLDASGNLIGGDVVLYNTRGSVTLGFGPGDMVSGQQAGTITIQVVRYTVTSATGAFARASGSGTFTVVQTTGKSATLTLETTPS